MWTSTQSSPPSGQLPACSTTSPTCIRWPHRCSSSSPASITPDHVRVLKQHQIGRVSMGIQSLDDQVLERLNRHHSGQEALAACELLISSGLMLNVDLIYGLPGQIEESFARDFQSVT